MPAFFCLTEKMRKSSIMTRPLFILFVLFITSLAVSGQGPVPKFSRYPVKVQKARVTKIDFKKNPDARSMRTRLSEGLRGGVNFAGHYVLVGWGCGTGCISGAIIDAASGMVYWPEQFNAMGTGITATGYVDKPVEYKKNSRLLIITGSPGTANDNAPDRPRGTYYYQWKNNKLRLVKFLKSETE